MPPNNIQFEQDKEWEKYKSNSYWNESEHMPVLVRLLMKTGLERRTCYYILFGVLIICSFITFEVLKKNFFPNSSSSPTYIEDIPDEIRETLPPEILQQLPSRNAK
mgnify:CR=1 FL=1